MVMNEYDLLFKLTKEKGNALALKYLIQNETDECVRARRFKCIGKANPLLACNILDSFYAGNNKLNALLSDIITKKFAGIYLKEYSWYSLNLLYFSLLYEDKIDEACKVVEHLIDSSNSKIIFIREIEKEYLNDDWITKHLVILLKYDLKDEISVFLGILSNKSCFSVDKKVLSDELLNIINKKNSVDGIYVKIVRYFDLINVFHDTFKKYLNGELGPLDLTTYNRVAFYLYCEEMGYDNINSKVPVCSSNSSIFMKNKYLFYIKSAINAKNRDFINTNWNEFVKYKARSRTDITRFKENYELLLIKLERLGEISLIFSNNNNQILEIRNVGRKLNDKDFSFLLDLVSLYNYSLSVGRKKNKVNPTTYKECLKKIKKLLNYYSHS